MFWNLYFEVYFPFGVWNLLFIFAAMRIPQQKIDEILSSANIVDVIAGYLSLRKRGKNFIGLCPFHQEKTPSFTVSEEKQIYHCFGCHAGGNVFKFLMEFKNISFVEAVQEVAEQFSIQLSYEEGYNVEKQTEQELLYEINIVAAKHFSDNLLNDKNCDEARDYFANRNIKLQTQRVFGLGYAKPGWDNFVNHIGANKIDYDKAVTLGLIDKKNSGGFYDKFRGRIIFPIFSPNGRVIAFGGRILEKNENVAKYLNSPESVIYHKRKTLYGLFHSKDEIRSQNKALLVEGYMDLISLYQAGIKNVVASSGTALTEEQVQLLSRYTKNIIVMFDADNAGQNAAMKSIETLLKQDFEVKILSLPEGEDPDSYVQEHGKEKFIENLDKAQDFLSYQTSRFKDQGMFDDPTTMTEAIRELVKTSALVKDQLKRNILLKSIANKFGLREKLIEDEAIRFFKSEYREEKKPRPAQKNFDPDNLEVETNQKENPKEKEIVSLLFEGDQIIMDHIFDNILPDDFGNATYRKLAQIVYDSYMENIILPSAIIEKIEDDTLKAFALKLTVDLHSISDRFDIIGYNHDPKYIARKLTDDVIRAYLILLIEDQIKQNLKTIETLENDLEKIELMKVNNDLNKEKQVIINQSPFYLNN